jgi:hypothetical protein
MQIPRTKMPRYQDAKEKSRYKFQRSTNIQPVYLDGFGICVLEPIWQLGSFLSYITVLNNFSNIFI